MRSNKLKNNLKKLKQKQKQHQRQLTNVKVNIGNLRRPSSLKKALIPLKEPNTYTPYYNFYQLPNTFTHPQHGVTFHEKIDETKNTNLLNEMNSIINKQKEAYPKNLKDEVNQIINARHDEQIKKHFLNFEERMNMNNKNQEKENNEDDEDINNSNILPSQFDITKPSYLADNANQGVNELFPHFTPIREAFTPNEDVNTPIPNELVEAEKIKKDEALERKKKNYDDEIESLYHQYASLCIERNIKPKPKSKMRAKGRLIEAIEGMNSLNF